MLYYQTNPDPKRDVTGGSFWQLPANELGVWPVCIASLTKAVPQQAADL